MLLLRLRVLTPTFIGNGSKLLPLEIYEDGNTVRVFKFEDLTEQLAEKFKGSPEKLKNLMLELSEKVRQKKRLVPLRELLNELNLRVEDLKPNYTLKVEGKFYPSEVEEFVKTLSGVYVPGSEIKGAFRTAVFYYVLTHYNRIWEQFLRELKEFLNNFSPKSLKPFAQHWENKIFAGKPLREAFRGRETPKGKEDLFKFLQVEDGEVRNPSGVLVLKEFRLRNSKRNLTVWVESLKENSTFSLKIGWNSEGLSRFLKTQPADLDEELREFWETLSEEKLLKILDGFTRDLLTFEVERRRNSKSKAERETSLREENYLSILDRLKREVFEENRLGKAKETETLERLRKEKGYLLRLGKFTGRFSHSVLLAVWKKDGEFFERYLSRRFGSKTYWEDGSGSPIGVCKFEIPI